MSYYLILQLGTNFICMIVPNAVFSVLSLQYTVQVGGIAIYYFRIFHILIKDATEIPEITILLMYG